MQDDRIHWNGQPIAVVLAETQEQADHAASLIRVAYEAEPPATTFEEARPNGASRQLVGASRQGRSATPRPRWPPRRISVDLDYRTPRHNHNAIEPHAVTVAWDGDELIVHDATQGVTAHGVDARAGLRNRGGAGPCDVALSWAAGSAARRCGSTTSWGGRVEARRASGQDHALA